MANRSIHPVQTLAGIVVLLTLAAVAGWILRQHQQIREPAPSTAASSSENTTTDSPLPTAPQGFEFMSAGEVFAADKLSDKIDGKADLYLSNGFQSLYCRRYQSRSGSGLWFELFVYDMGHARNALAVFSNQQRSSPQPSDVTALAYTTGDALFAAYGKWYLELIASEASPEAGTALAAAARAFVAAQPAGTAGLFPELAAMPEAGRVAGTLVLNQTDVFGCDKLDQVFSQEYACGDARVTVFASARKSEAEALSLLGHYRAYLEANGAQKALPAEWPPDATAWNLFGLYEVIWNRGALVLGVHEAPSPGAAATMAARLDQAVIKKGSEK